MEGILQSGIRRLYRKRKLRFRDRVNKIVKRFIDVCVEKNVVEIVCGDLNGIRKNCRRNNDSRKRNMVINNFAYSLHPSFTRVMGFRLQEQAVYNSGMGACQFDSVKNIKLISMISQENCRQIILPILDRYSDSKTMAEQITEVSK